MINGIRCKKCDFITADRIIAIAPKNYLVENSKYDFLSKRKFKGVRKRDYWLPLKYFDADIDIARKKVKSLSQDDIRKFREFKCCVKCISKDLLYKKCNECSAGENKMRKAYTTDMFEHLVRGEKIAVFCSNINRIRYSEQLNVEWEYTNATNAEPTLKDLHTILKNHKKDKKSKVAVSIKFGAEDENEEAEYFEKLEDALMEVEEEPHKWKKVNIIKNFNKSYRRFKNELNTKSLKDIFKLKQQYLVKVI